MADIKTLLQVHMEKFAHFFGAEKCGATVCPIGSGQWSLAPGRPPFSQCLGCFPYCHPSAPTTHISHTAGGPLAPRQNRLLILSDNQAAIHQAQSLLKGRTSLFRSVFTSILRDIRKALHPRHAPIHIAYIPVHVGFAGNTLADSMAKWPSWLPITQV